MTIDLPVTRDHYDSDGTGQDVQPRGTWCEENLRRVCATLIHSDCDAIRAIEINGLCPAEPGAALYVLRLTRAVADDFHLRTWYSLADGLLTVHFARPER